MLMKPDKKKNMASLILGASQGPMDGLKSSNEELAEAPQMDPGLMAAADEMLQAIHSKDAKSLVDAMKSFMDMCESSESPEPQEQE